jgi:hypothetical protein
MNPQGYGWTVTTVALPIAVLIVSVVMFKDLVGVMSDAAVADLYQPNTILSIGQAESLAITGKYFFSLAMLASVVLSILAMTISFVAIRLTLGARRGLGFILGAVVTGLVITYFMLTDFTVLHDRLLLTPLKIFTEHGLLDDEPGKMLRRVFVINSVFGYPAAASLIFAMAALAVRPAKLTDSQLYARIQWLNRLLTAGAAMLVLNALAVSAYFRFPLSFLVEENLTIANQLTKSLLVFWGGTSSLVLLVTYLPVLVALFLASGHLAAQSKDGMTAQEKSQWLTTHGLNISPTQALTRLAIALAPALTAPGVEVFSQLMG